MALKSSVIITPSKNNRGEQVNADSGASDSSRIHDSCSSAKLRQPLTPLTTDSCEVGFTRDKLSSSTDIFKDREALLSPQDSGGYAALILEKMRSKKSASLSPSPRENNVSKATFMGMATPPSKSDTSFPSLSVTRADGSSVSIILNDKDIRNESFPSKADKVSEATNRRPKSPHRGGLTIKQLLEDIRTDAQKVQTTLKTHHSNAEAAQMINMLQQRLERHINEFVDGSDNKQSLERTPNEGLDFTKKGGHNQPPVQKVETKAVAAALPSKSETHKAQSPPLPLDQTQTGGAQAASTQPANSTASESQIAHPNHMLYSLPHPNAPMLMGQSTPLYPAYNGAGYLGPCYPPSHYITSSPSNFGPASGGLPPPNGASSSPQQALLGYQYQNFQPNLLTPIIPQKSCALSPNGPLLMQNGPVTSIFPGTASSPPWTTPSQAGLPGPFHPILEEHGDEPHGGSSRPSPILLRSRKRARHELVDDIKCQQCGTNTTPEWRRGPNGFRTLCNACGLFHAKIARKKGEEEANRLLRKRPSVMSD